MLNLKMDKQASMFACQKKIKVHSNNLKKNSNNQKEAEMLSAGYFYSQKALRVDTMEGT